MSKASVRHLFILFIILRNYGILGISFPRSLMSAQYQAGSTNFGFDMAGCGESKGCFMSPEKCQDAGCDIYVSWRDTGSGTIHFELSMAVSSTTSQWIAVGFSSDTRMEETSVVSCLNYGTTSEVIATYNPATSTTNEPLTDKSLGLVSTGSKVTVYGDRMECEFDRYTTVDSGNAEAAKVFPLTVPYYFLLASGPTTATGTVQEHSKHPLITTEKIDTSQNNIVGGSYISPLIKAHACLMIAAWVLLSGLGILNARFFKPVLGQEFLKLKLWFLVHRTLMTLVVLLTLSGFIIVFCYVEGFSEVGGDEPAVSSAHPIIGILVMALSLTNPIMALFRPHPGTKNRWIFNWAHRSVGESARILAIINIMIAFWMPEGKLFTDIWMFWVMVGLVVVHIAVELMFFVLQHQQSKSSQKSSSSNLEMMESPEDNNNLKLFQTAMLLLYGIMMLACSIAMFVEIGMK